MDNTTTTQIEHPKRSRIMRSMSAFFSSRTKAHYLWYGFYLLVILSLINIGIMTLHLLDKDYDFPILKHSYINAIYPGQDVNDTMYTDIIRIRKFDETTIDEGDQVILYNDFDIAEYWTETVYDVRDATRQLELTYDNTTFITTSFDNVVATYDRNANVFGTLYYTARYTDGYTLLFLSHLFVLAGYYFIFLVDRKHE
jgi:hypothetical protein